MRKQIVTILLSFFLFGFLLRLVYFKQITFGWDQARDALQAIDIWRGDHIKIIGPNTDLPGLFHGPIYWYLISPVYHFTNGNIYAVKLFLILINLANIFLIYVFSKKLFKNDLIAIVSSFLFCVSFESIQYARWLSNPSTALLTVVLSFYGLWAMINQKGWGMPLMLISWALSVHFQFFLLYQLFIFIPVLIFLFVNKKLVLSKLNILLSLFSLFILSSFFISEVKFGFQGLKSMLLFLFEDKTLFRSFTANLFNFFDRIVFTFYFNIFGVNLFFAGLFALFVIGYSVFYILKKQEFKREILFLLSWLLSPLLIFPFEKVNAYFATVGNLFPAIVLSVFIIFESTKKLKIRRLLIFLIFLFIFVGQTGLSLKQNKKGEVLFSVQEKMILSDELKVIDWVYNESKNQNFAINTVTNPLFINTTWGYLFDWYGKNKYGRMPIWLGYPQNDFFGSNIKYAKIDNLTNSLLFLIIEPTPGIPEIYIAGYSKFEDTRSKLIEKKKIGGFTIEKRILNKNKPFSRDELVEIIKKS